jgi:plasmid stabilization system protein ParE
MKRYKVILHPDAETDIDSSFEWGGRAWGQKNAKAWVRELRNTIRNRLTAMPLGYPLAPESEGLGISVRHLIVGRYRILFIVEKRTVTILHVRGPFPAQRSFRRSGRESEPLKTPRSVGP